MAVTSAHDIITLLLEDHHHVEDLFSRFETSPGRWGELFPELVATLVRHEVAEEEIVYPTVRHALAGGERLADERIAEQSEAEELLSKMEKEGTSGSGFGSDLMTLRDAVLAHAQKEEQTVFGPLGNVLKSEDREKLAKRYERAKAMAPTHPHPNAPDTPPGNMMLGPVAALADRIRDAIRRD
jgi:hemerythrin superfamily protein